MKQDGKTLELLKSFEAMNIPSIDCMVMQHGECVFRYQSGFSDVECTKPVDGSERYNLYSCSKAVTCTAAMQLVEKDIIRLDDAVYEYLPEFKNMQKMYDGKLEAVKTVMNLRHLFTMTAGLNYAVASDSIKRGQAETNGRLSTRDAMKYIACEPLLFEPGSNWQYSLCHDVLAAVVEAASGKRFGEYVKENIFDVLGMKKSTFMLPDAELDQLAAQYRYDGTNKVFNCCGPNIQNYKLGRDYESGGAGMISTVEDYITFLDNLRAGEKLLKRETIARMTVPQISKTVEKSFILPDYSYGLGIRCPYPGSKGRDYGWGGAAGSFLAVLPDCDAVIFHAQHVLSSPNQSMRYLLPDAVRSDI